MNVTQPTRPWLLELYKECCENTRNTIFNWWHIDVLLTISLSMLCRNYITYCTKQIFISMQVQFSINTTSSVEGIAFLLRHSMAHQIGFCTTLLIILLRMPFFCIFLINCISTTKVPLLLPDPIHCVRWKHTWIIRIVWYNHEIHTW